jgi:hypothetical protein
MPDTTVAVMNRENAGTFYAEAVVAGSQSVAGYSRQIVVEGNGVASTVIAPIGVWTPTYIADAAYYGWVNQSDGAQGDQISFDFACDAGVYDIELFHLPFQSRGIYTVKVDGAVAGTIDGYAASLAPARTALAGVAITVGRHTLSFLMATKNASATGYIGMIEHVVLTRTA